MFRVCAGVSAMAMLLLAGGWLLGEDPKKGDDTPPPVRGTLPANWKKLGLSDQQVREVHRIRGTYLAKIDILKQKIKDLEADEKTELMTVLTDAQKARLKEIKLGETPKPKDPTDTKDPKDKGTEKPAEKTATKDKSEDK